MEVGRTVYRVCGSGGKRRRIASESFCYVPIPSTLKQVLGREDVLDHISTNHRTSGSSLHDFCDGQEYHEHPLFSSYPSALQIIAYYDDIEVCNHRLVRSIFLFTIGNLHPKFRSAFKCIFLFAVAKTNDINKYSPDAILSPFVSDINTLASTGITITCSNRRTQTFKGIRLAFLADNLASHTIDGLKDSFSLSYRFCRLSVATHALAACHFLSHVSSKDCFKPQASL